MMLLFLRACLGPMAVWIFFEHLPVWHGREMMLCIYAPPALLEQWENLDAKYERPIPKEKEQSMSQSALGLYAGLVGHAMLSFFWVRNSNMPWFSGIATEHAWIHLDSIATGGFQWQEHLGQPTKPSSSVYILCAQAARCPSILLDRSPMKRHATSCSSAC